MMKIILVDNYDRPWHKPIVVVENVAWNYADRIARLLNEDEEEDSCNYYLVKEDDWKRDDI